MRNLLVLFSVIVLLSGAVLWAQAEPHKRQGQLFGAVGAAVIEGESSGVFQFGGAFNAYLAGGLGVTTGLGYAAPFESPGDGIGIFSPGVVYAFNRGNKTIPFVNAGYSLFFREGTAHGFFFGGGVDHWFGENWGLHIEGRDQVMPEYNYHLIEARFGIALR
jgi:hypothetical protein